ncbi:MAG: hypothetical protein ACTSX9_09420 [Candidatus Njordarchaeales archaeon]
MDKNLREIYLLLAKKGAKTINELSILTGRSITELEHYLTTLEKDGLILRLLEPTTQLIAIPPANAVLYYLSEAIRLIRNIRDRFNNALLATSAAIQEMETSIIEKIDTQERVIKERVDREVREINVQLKTFIDATKTNLKKVLNVFEETRTNLERVRELAGEFHESFTSLSTRLKKLSEDILTTYKDTMHSIFVNYLQDSESVIGPIIEKAKEYLEGTISLLDTTAKRINDVNVLISRNTDILLRSLEREKKESFDKLHEALSKARASTISFLDNIATSLYPSIEKSLSTTFDALIDSITSSFTVALSQYETAAKILVEDMRERWDSITTLLRTQAESLLTSSLNAFNELGKDTKKEEETFFEVLNKILNTFNTKEKKLRNIMDSTFRVLIEEIRGLEPTLIEYFDRVRNEWLEYYQEIQLTATNYISQRYDDLRISISNLIEDLNNVQEKLVGEIKEYYESSVKASLDSLKKALEAINELALTVSEDFNNSVKAVLPELEDNVARSIDATNNELRTKLLNISRKFTSIISSSSIKAERLHKELLEKIRELSREDATQLDNALKFLESQGIEFSSEQKKYLNKIKRSMIYRNRGIISLVNKFFNEYKQSLARLTEEILLEINKFSASFSEYLKELSKDMLSSLERSLSFSISRVQNNYNQQVERMKNQINSQLQLLTTISEEALKRIDSDLKDYIRNTTSNLEDLLEREREFQKELVSNLSKAAEELNSIITERLKETRKQLSSLIEDYLLKSQGITKGEILREIEELKQSLEKEVTEVKNKLGDYYKQVNSVIEKNILRIKNALENIENVLKVAESEISESIKRFNKTISANYQTIRENLENRRTDLENLFNEKTNILKEKLDRSLAELKDTIENSFDKILEDQKALVNEILEKIKQPINSLNDRIANRISELVSDINEALRSLKERESTFLQEWEEAKESINQQLSELRKSLDENVKAKMDTALKALKEQIEKMFEKYDEMENLLETTNKVLDENEEQLNQQFLNSITNMENKLSALTNNLRETLYKDYNIYRNLLKEIIEKGLDEFQKSLKTKIEDSQEHLSAHLEKIENDFNYAKDLSQSFIQIIKENASKALIIRDKDSIVTKIIDIITRVREKIAIASPVLTQQIIDAVKKASERAVIEIMIPKGLELPEELLNENIIIRVIERELPVALILRDDEEVLVGLMDAGEELAVLTFSQASVQMMKLLLRAYLK